MDEEQVLGNVGDSVTLGSETVTIRGLPILMSRAWRQRSKTVMEMMVSMAGEDLSNPEATVKGLSTKQLQYMAVHFQDDLLALVGYWLWLQSEAEKGLKRPQESEEEQWIAMISEDSNDAEILEAFKTIRVHAFPFGRPGSGPTKT